MRPGIKTKSTQNPAGTYRPDRANAAEVFPRFSCGYGCSRIPGRESRHKWEELAPILLRNGLLSEADTDLLAVYCQTWARWLEAESMLETESTTTGP